MQMQESWVLIRPVDYSRSPQSVQAALQEFYRRIAADLRAEGVAVTPAGAQPGKSGENDTLGHVAAERVTAGQDTLSGIPIFEPALLSDTMLVPGPPSARAACLRASHAARTASCPATTIAPPPLRTRRA